MLDAKEKAFGSVTDAVALAKQHPLPEPVPARKDAIGWDRTDAVPATRRVSTQEKRSFLTRSLLKQVRAESAVAASLLSDRNEASEGTTELLPYWRDVALRVIETVNRVLPPGTDEEMVRKAFRVANPFRGATGHSRVTHCDRAVAGLKRKLWREEVEWACDQRFPDRARAGRLEALRQYEQKLQKKGFAAVPGLLEKQSFPVPGMFDF